MIDKIWQEKHRPQTVKDVISVHTPKILKHLENPLAIQNFLFHSRIGGTGKTSMAKAIKNDLKCDYLMLNASKDRSIEIVRTKVADFCMSKSNNPNAKRMVWMDEGEKLTKDAMDALKNMIEMYEANAFFVFTTNDINKIPQPMQSRFNVMEFSQPDKQEVVAYIKKVLDSEEQIYDIEAIVKLVDQEYPSIRAMVNRLQDMVIEGKPIIEENIVKDTAFFDSIWEQIKTLDFKAVKKVLYEKGVDCEGLNKHLFFKVAYEGQLDLKKEIKILQILARNERDFRLGADSAIVFVPSVAEIMLVMKSD